MPTTDTFIEQLEPDVAEPKVLNREILGLVAQGGFARVYLARNVVSESFEALKVLHAEWADSAEARERFSREALNAAAVMHRNVVSVVECGLTSTGAPFLAMEYVEGPTLAEVMRRHPQFPLERACAIALEIAEALNEAHQLGIVHRDLTPANILLATAPGQDPLMDGTVKVVDFGLARAMRDPSQQVTRAGVTLGTLAYMSPEQLISSDLADARSDIFSLGCILYEMLTGEKVFGDDPLVRRSRTQVEGVRRIRRDASRRLDRLVLRALAAEPERRVPSALAFSSALRSVLNRPTHRPATKSLAAACLGLSVLAGSEFWLRTPPAVPSVAAAAQPYVVAPDVRSPSTWDSPKSIAPAAGRGATDTARGPSPALAPTLRSRTSAAKGAATVYDTTESIPVTQLGTDSGLAHLFAVVNDTATPPGSREPSNATPSFVVQFAAILSLSVADSLASVIQIEDLHARVTSSVVGGDTVHRVVLGPFLSHAQAERIARASGRDAWVYQR